MLKAYTNSKAIRSSSNCKCSRIPFWSKFGLRARVSLESKVSANFKVLALGKPQRNKNIGAPGRIECKTRLTDHLRFSEMSLKSQAESKV